MGGLFGCFHRNGAFDEDAPLHRQQKGIVQKLVDLMEGSAGKGALLLLGREVSPLAAHILPARGLAQDVIQGFDVVGPQLKQSPQAGYKIRSVGFTISGVIFLCVAGRDEGLLELNGKTYMLSLKVYETVKTDVAYVQDKTVSQIQAKDRILEHLKHKPSITNQKAQELCGFNKNQTYYILHQMCKDGILQPDGVGRGTKYKSAK